MKLAVVIQRFGKEIADGPENLCRETLRRLARKHFITVYTTTALDHLTWRRHYAVGVEDDEGMTIRRFQPIRERNAESFRRLSHQISSQQHTEIEEAQWLEERGPFCPELVEALRGEQDLFDVILFFAYQSCLTVAGLHAVEKPIILVPLAHREPAASLRIYRDVFQRPEGLIFNSHLEERFVTEFFRPSAKHRLVAGPGVTLPAHMKSKMRLAAPCILYAGGVDTGNECAEVIEYFIRFRVHYMFCRLYLMGMLPLQPPKHPEIHALGTLIDEEKFGAYRDASVTVLPSTAESRSIIALESLACGTPVLVNGHCEVLRDHCLRGNAGLYYGNFEEFGEALQYILRRRDQASQFGASGKRYVLANYTWDKILAKYDSMFQSALNR